MTIARIKKTKLAILALPRESSVDLFFFIAIYISIIASKSYDKNMLKIGKTRPKNIVKRTPKAKVTLFSFKNEKTRIIIPLSYFFINYYPAFLLINYGSFYYN